MNWMYEIWWTLNVEGVVERQDVVGTLYHEMDRLGDSLNLDELEDKGLIDGAVVINLESKDGNTTGSIRIRCDLDTKRVAEFAAALETIERIGPCKAKIAVDRIGLALKGKQKYIENRSEELLTELEESAG